MKIETFCLSAWFALLLVAPVHAQITFINFPGITDFDFDHGGIVVENVQPDAFLDFPDLVRYILPGDVTFEPDPDQSRAFYSLSTGFEVTIGALPVNVQQLSLTGSAEISVTGGARGAPATDLTVSVLLADLDDPDAALTGTSITRHLDGNVASVIDETVFAPPYVMLPGQVYRVGLELLVEVETTGLLLDPAATVLHRFGGSGELEGYEIEFRSTTVPEPATWTLGISGALGAGYALVRRRTNRRGRIQPSEPA